MCLETVEKVFLDPKDENWKIGYKVVKLANGRFISIHFPFSYEKGVNIDKPKDEFIAPLGKLFYWDIAYPSGYHIFCNKQDAVDYAILDEIIVQVRYRKVVAIGKQKGETIVAREFRIMKVEEHNDK